MSRFAQLVRGAIDDSMKHSARSAYAAEKKIGVSDIGHCREFTRRMIVGEEFTDEQDDYLAAFVGTAVGDRTEDAIVARAGGVKQMEVVVQLEIGEGYVLNLVGHPDLVFPLEPAQGTVLPEGATAITNVLYEGKTKDGLGVVKRYGAQTNHKYQATLYAKALIDMGVLDENATLVLAYIDRSGSDPDPYIEEWTYDPAILEEAMAWFGDVLYAVAHGEEASKDKPRDWCLSYCEYATSCRLGDTDVEGLITDETILRAIDAFDEGARLEREGKRLKDSAKADLVNVSGNTHTHTVRWVHINETVIEPGIRRGYDRLYLKARKGAK